jgi:hypothetical protein
MSLESLFDKPRSSSSFSQSEMATIANFCQDPAGVTSSDHDDGATNDAAFADTYAHGRGCRSPVQPSSIFSISVMEQAEHDQLEMLHPSEPSSDDAQTADKVRRPGLARTESIKAWFGALSHERLLQTALEKLKLEGQDKTDPSYEPRWHECMDEVDGVAWVNAFSGMLSSVAIYQLENSNADERTC